MKSPNPSSSLQVPLCRQINSPATSPNISQNTHYSINSLLYRDRTYHPCGDLVIRPAATDDKVHKGELEYTDKPHHYTTLKIGTATRARKKPTRKPSSNTPATLSAIYIMRWYPANSAYCQWLQHSARHVLIRKQPST